MKMKKRKVVTLTFQHLMVAVSLVMKGVWVWEVRITLMHTHAYYTVLTLHIVCTYALYWQLALCCSDSCYQCRCSSV